jgi:hypothetical protein
MSDRIVHGLGQQPIPEELVLAYWAQVEPATQLQVLRHLLASITLDDVRTLHADLDAMIEDREDDSDPWADHRDT